MSRLQLFLFGRFDARWDKRPLHSLDGRKLRELVCYLLIHRGRCHTRERLAELLWENSSSSQSKQYLRRALWQLQSSVGAELDMDLDLICVDADWLQLNADVDYWSDATQFENAFDLVRDTRGRDLSAEQAQALEAAVALYRADLLESWYQDWCLIERERFQNMYLMMLDKLMSYCEAHGQFERGILLGDRILRCDLARERTYRRQIRLAYLAGDRTGALRRYQRCVEVLQAELGVKPSKRTTAVYEQVRVDRPAARPAPPPPAAGRFISAPAGLVRRLEALQEELESIKVLLSDTH